MRTGGIIKDGLKTVVHSLGPGPSPGASAVPVVEGLVGFAVAHVFAHSPSPGSSAATPAPPLLSFFASTVPSPKIALERLSKVHLIHLSSYHNTEKSTENIHTLLTYPIIIITTTVTITITTDFHLCLHHACMQEVAGAANGPVNLLEAMGMEVLYRKTLTPYAWGTLLFDHM